MPEEIDILEQHIQRDWGLDVLDLLLIDQSMTIAKGGETHNIFWATHDYEKFGEGYEYNSEIKSELITKEGKERIIMPRVAKNKHVQATRVKQKAEVFTPSWVCNMMINIADERRFGRKNLFNIESEDHKAWESRTEKVTFSEGKTWMDYVMFRVMEITCGEAPFLVSRYDTTTGNPICVKQRVGMLDRKLRLINENVAEVSEWLDITKKAYQNTLAYEWQGDNLLIARENLLYTFIDNYRLKFNQLPQQTSVKEIAEIISWNVWQMDGLKGVIPNSCHDTEKADMYGYVERFRCPGCEKNNYKLHNGVQCLIKNWETGDAFGYNEIKEAKEILNE